MKLYPSILSADFAHLQDEVESVLPYVDGFHIDVMDGHFVPNLTFGAPVFRCVDFGKPQSVHLMVTNPERYIEEYAELGVDTFIVHIEVTHDDTAGVISAIHKAGMKAGLSLNPDTPIESITPYIDRIDEVLVMSVFPGFGGQSFIADSLEKVKELKMLCPELVVSIDGGINAETAKQAQQAGVDILIAGSYIFGSEDRKKACLSLTEI